MKILLAEDDHDLGGILLEYIKISGFDAFLAKDGEEALSVYKSFCPDICILDVMMPKLDGFSVAQIISKRNPDIPFVFLTAKNLKEDKIRGLKLGAADYITKPFDPEELLLRLQNIIQRYQKGEKKIYRIGNTTLDCELLRLSCGNSTVELTATESDLLLHLFQNTNHILERNSILSSVWGDEDYFVGRSMDVFISRIRKYLASDSSITLRTVRGRGFILEVNETSSIPKG